MFARAYYFLRQSHHNKIWKGAVLLLVDIDMFFPWHGRFSSLCPVKLSVKYANFCNQNVFTKLLERWNWWSIKKNKFLSKFEKVFNKNFSPKQAPYYYILHQHCVFADTPALIGLNLVLFFTALFNTLFRSVHNLVKIACLGGTVARQHHLWYVPPFLLFSCYCSAISANIITLFASDFMFFHSSICGH
jgi:hypothetical protein